MPSLRSTSSNGPQNLASRSWLLGQAHDQAPDLGIERRASRPSMRARPLVRHQPPVPAHDGLGVNEERTPAFARQHPACGSQQCAIPHPVDGAFDLTAKNHHLVAKHEILKADLLDGAILGGEHAEQPTKQQLED